MKKILIVEDDKTISDALEMYLKSSNYESKSVPDGLRGYLQSNIWKPDLILMDIFIGNNNGVDVARDVEDINIPVIFMTGSDSKKAKDEALACKSTVGFFEKPLNMEKLLKTIKEKI